MSLRTALAAALVFVCALAPEFAAADPAPIVSLSLKDHHFSPAQFSVPAGVKVRIELANQDAATEEFDSHDLRIEELVTPHGRTSFLIGPLTPGDYAFMGEFHPATAQGRVTAIQGR